MRPARVLHILQSMNRGGIENFLMNQYRHIDREKVQFDFLINEQNVCAFEDEITALGGRIYRMPRLSATGAAGSIAALDRFFKAHPEYAICHSHYNGVSSLILWIAKRNGVPHRIAHSHNCLYKLSGKNLAQNILKLPVKAVATELFACSSEAGRWLYGDRALRSGSVTIVRNAIEAADFDFDPKLRSSMRHRLGIADDIFVVGHTGSFTHQKNHRFAIDILNRMVKIVPEVRFLFIGDGPLKAEIERYAEESGVSDNCLFTGSVSNTGSYIQAMDAFVLPSFHEGLPLVAIEAQTAGLRCFISDTVSRECRITDSVDFLPLSDGAQRWAQAIAAARRYERRGRRDEIAAAGYDAASSAAELENFYVTLLKTNG